MASVFRTAICAAVALVATAARAETLSFAPLPMESQETVIKQFKPMLSYLESHLGAEIRIEFSTSYGEILEKFRHNKIDFAYLGPLPYLTLRDQFPAAEPVAHFLEASGKPTYTCGIVALADGKIALDKAKGLKVALTQPLSTCGYMATDGLLRQAGSALDANKYRYLDKHDEVALAVTRGEYELGGLKTAIGRKYAHMGLTVVAESDPLPSFALVANGITVPKARIEALRAAITALHPLDNEADKDVTRGWGDNIRFGAVPAADGDYDALRRLRGKLKTIPEKGNF